MNVYMFPGQGSQKKGMGGELFNEISEFTHNEAEIDNLLGYSLRSLCLEDQDNRLNQTQYTQPCLYAVNALHYLKRISETNRSPDFLVGHSLGEYDALMAAGAFDFLTGLRLVQKRGELMAQAKNGGMAAVIGLDAETLQAAIVSSGLSGLDIANYNSPAQIVISGPSEELEQLRPSLENAGGRAYIPLPVSAAFHSRYMQEAANAFAEFLHPFQLNTLNTPVISNVTGRPYSKNCSPDEIKASLVKQITQSVQWTDSIRYLMGKQVTEYEEIGPGNVLKGLVNNIRREARPLEFGDEVSSATELDVAMSSDSPIKAVASKNSLVQSESVYFDPNGNYGNSHSHMGSITKASLGSHEFKADYKIKYAYLAGAMYKGIASVDMVIALGKAGLMGYLGTGGMKFDQLESSIIAIQTALDRGQSYGMNLLSDLNNPEMEDRTVDLYLKYGVRYIEAAAFMQITPSLVRFRLKGIHRSADGHIVAPHHVLAKVSRPEVAATFMQPAPDKILQKLLDAGQLTQEEVELGRLIPMAKDICVEADSGGHTDQGVAYALMPSMLSLQSEMMKKYKYKESIRVGAAGGIGTPQAAMAAFILGADFILTGSINQCTVEAGTSDSVKRLLQEVNVQDTDYAPAGDMFELGAKVQVLKKGVFFPARANKLYELYQRYQSLDEIDEKTLKKIENTYFKRSCTEVWEETKNYYMKSKPEEVTKAEKNSKHKMAMIFKWYFVHTTRLAMQGIEDQRVDYQVHCGPAMGAFNQWVKGTELEDWRNRHVDTIADKLMQETAELFNQRYTKLIENIVTTASDATRQPLESPAREFEASA